ncbi:MAG: ABC transporter permease [Candidatus Dormibacteraceae bacterium]
MVASVTGAHVRVGSSLRSWIYLQWLFVKRIFAGHSPLKFTALMTVVNVAVGIGSFYYLSQIVGTHGARGRIYMQFGGVAGFIAVGLSMNAILTVGCNSIVRAISDEQSMGTLGYWMMCQPRLLSLVLRSSVGEFLLAGVNAIATFVLMVLLFRISFHINWPSLFVMGAVSALAVGGVGLWAAGLNIGGLKGTNPVIWAWGVTTNFMSGVYAPIEIFHSNPILWPIMYLDPVSHGLLAMRQAILRNASLTSPALLADLSYMAVFSGVIFGIGVWQFRQGVNRALALNKLIES